MRKNNFLSAFGILLSALNAFAWGQKGHDTVAYIAENHLTQPTKERISDLLEGKSIVYWSNWLDNASHTPAYDYTLTWHYKNIDADETFRSARIEPKGDVVTALTEQIEILGDSLKSDDEKVLALKIIVHLMGDIHQPMHLGRRSDRGGNIVNVTFFKSPVNLHSAWDSRILENGHKWSYTEWQNQIDRVTREKEQEIINNGNAYTWAEETYNIAKEIYDVTPYGFDIAYDYIASWTPTIEEQLLKGGLRLADVLNMSFDPEYSAGYRPRAR